MFTSRRDFLNRSGMGIGSVALSWLMQREQTFARPVSGKAESFDLLPKQPFERPKAQAMISMFMQGGPSHIDLMDPKPLLEKFAGKPFPGKIKYDNAAQASSTVLACPWKYSRCGESGMEISELLPHLQGIADDITIIRSMTTGVNNHGQSIHSLNTGRVTPGNPALGAWLSYGLGNQTDELPAFMVLKDPRGLPVEGVRNWSNGWLPSLYQGTVVRSKEPRIANLDAPPHLKGEPQKRYLSYLDQLNRQHLDQHPGELELEARISSYELAAKMQTAAKDALDISGESKATKQLYGIDDPATEEFGTRCLIARRLVERGVRFVQLFTKNQYWDHHGTIRKRLPESCQYIDQPAAALVQDLKGRGLLDTTLVHWGGEMGRLPVIQNDTGPDKVGRDHNTYGFSMWLAGGGVRGGHIHGATDEWGHHAVLDKVTHHDYHATLLHLFGLDANKLRFKRNGLPVGLIPPSDSGEVIRAILKS